MASSEGMATKEHRAAKPSFTIMGTLRIPKSGTKAMNVPRRMKLKEKRTKSTTEITAGSSLDIEYTVADSRTNVQPSQRDCGSSTDQNPRSTPGQPQS